MSVTVGVLEAKLVADTIGFDRALDKSEGRMKTFAKAAGTAGLAGAVAGLGYALHAGVHEFLQSQIAAAQTEAVLKSTGGVANVTAAHVDDLAKKIMFHTGANVNAVRASENLLLAFTNVRNEAGKGNDVFDRAIGLIQDYAVRTGRDANQATVIFGKALQDPAKYLGALSRAGVVFTAQQKDQIKTLEASGHLMDAQKVVLGALQQKVGGAAEAYGKTLPGQVEIAKQAFSLWSGELIAKVVPAISTAVTELRDHWPQIQSAISQAWGTVKPILSALGDVFQSVADIVKDHWPTISRNLDAVKTVVQDAAKVITAALQLVVDLLHGNWSKAWDDLKTVVSGSLDAVKTVLKNEVADVKALALALGTAAKNALEDGLTGVGAFALSTIDGLKNILTNQLNAVKAAALSLGSAVYDGIVGGVTGIGKWFLGTIGGLADIVTGAVKGMKEAASGLGAAVISGLEEGLSGLAKMLKGAIKTVTDAVVGLFDGLPGAVKNLLGISSPSKVFAGIGEAIVQGVIHGIESEGGSLVKHAENLFGSLAHKAGQVATDVGSAISGALSGGGGAASPGDARALGQMLATQYGWGTGAAWNALDQLWTRESGWNPLARNPQSGAFGIPQALPASKMPPIAQAGDATSQIMWGLNYIRERYGNPLAAWAHELKVGWYDRGGFLPPGLSLAYNGLGRPEPVGGAGVVNNYFTFPNYVGSKDELVRVIRTAKAQYENRNGPGNPF